MAYSFNVPQYPNKSLDLRHIAQREYAQVLYDGFVMLAACLQQRKPPDTRKRSRLRIFSVKNQIKRMHGRNDLVDLIESIRFEERWYS